MYKNMHEDNTNHTQFDTMTANFEAEEQIINDKLEFGRIRASLRRDTWNQNMDVMYLEEH